MLANPECVTCRRLGSCSFTDAAKVYNHFVCTNYVEVTNQEIIHARCDVINKYGEAGLKALISPSKNEEA